MSSDLRNGPTRFGVFQARAYRMTGAGRVGLVEVADPVPGTGQVRLDVLAAGVCHSDLHVLDSGAGSGWALPFTLGHEICGRVAALGPGIEDLAVGDQVVVHGRSTCGGCPPFRRTGSASSPAPRPPVSPASFRERVPA
jgi:D-arabinose 1-dehydrogenase-like Zn-dependent alcohol dehydrogenase